MIVWNDYTDTQFTISIQHETTPHHETWWYSWWNGRNRRGWWTRKSSKKKEIRKVNYDYRSVPEPSKEILDMYIAQRNGVGMGSLPNSYDFSCVSSYPISLKHAVERLWKYTMTLEIELLVVDLCNAVTNWSGNDLIELFNIMGRI